MRSGSIATRARSPSPRPDHSGSSSGFTLIEALVALAVVLAFAAALGRLLFQAHRIMLSAEGQVAAQILLRSLLDTPLDRTSLASISRDGETQGLRWRIVAMPGRRRLAAAVASSIPVVGALLDPPPGSRQLGRLSGGCKRVIAIRPGDHG